MWMQSRFPVIPVVTSMKNQDTSEIFATSRAQLTFCVIFKTCIVIPDNL